MRKTSVVIGAKIINIVVAIILCVAGIFMIIKPYLDFATERLILGIMALIIGCAKLIGYFSNDMYRLAFQFDLAIGIFIIILGVFAFISGENNADKYVLAVGFYVVLDGGLILLSAIDSKRFGITNWQWILFTSIGIVVLGVFVLAAPHFDAVVDNVAVGIALFVDGVENAWITAYTVKVRSGKKYFSENKYTVQNNNEEISGGQE